MMKFKANRTQKLAVLLSITITCIPAVRIKAQVRNTPLDNSVPTSQPSFGEVGRSPQQQLAEFSLTTRLLQEIVPTPVLMSADKRAEFAPRAIPILYHRLQLIDELAAEKQITPVQIIKLRAMSQAMLYLLEDAATVRKVNSMAVSSDAARKLSGQIIQANASWIGAGTDGDRQTKAADDLEKLDRANPADIRLTQLTMEIAGESRTLELETRMLKLVVEVMTDPLARISKRDIKQQLDADAKLQQLVGKPIELGGKSTDGDDFASANWKGKVVVVDFWATWCAPCRAEMPHLLEVYNAYHSKGLEIVGVSSDQTLQPITDFTAQNKIPWTMLFDPATAKTRMHPLCTQFGITGLPVIFIIDRQGILRGVSGWKQLDDMLPGLLGETQTATQPGQ